jgi:hypothetical protein
MWTDGQTDRQADITMKIVAFRNFANVPKNDQNIALTLFFLDAETTVNNKNKNL